MKLLSPRPAGTLLATAALALSLAACETDLDPNDAYRETTFIYAVLDPSLRDAAGQPVQRISINKAYLNTGTNAITIAAGQPDSVTFPAGVIDARLEVLRADSSVKVFYPLERVPNDSKLPGEFAQRGQFVYQTPTGEDVFQNTDSSNLFRIVARNARTGTVAQGTTNLPLVRLPNQLADDGARYLTFASAYVSLGLGPAQQNEVREFDPAPLSTPRVAVRTQRRAGLYSVQLDFRFLEVLDGVTTPRTLTWDIITNERIEANNRPEVITRTLANEAFFSDFLTLQLNPTNDPPGLRRRFVADSAIVFRAYAGSPQWARYQEIFTSSSALTQTTPEYTNVRGGRGLVTGRVQHTVVQRINTLPNGSGRRAFARYPQFKFDF